MKEKYKMLVIVVAVHTADKDAVDFIREHNWFLDGGGHIILKCLCGNVDIFSPFKCYEQNLRIIFEKDSGIYDAWNQAIKYIDADYITFLGVDDVISIHYVDEVLREIKSDKNLDVLYGNAVLKYGSKSRYIESPIYPELFCSSRKVLDIPHPGSFNNVSLFNLRKFPFDTSFKLAGDLEFYIFCSVYRKFQFKKIDRVQAVIGAEGLSRSHVAAKIYNDEWKAIESKHQVSLGVWGSKFTVTYIISLFPRLFSIIRNLSWRVRYHHIGTQK